MRLLVVSQYFWPEDFRINELVGELVERGHAVTVLTGKPNYPSGEIDPAFRADPARFANYRGARVLRVPMLARRRGAWRLVLNYASYAVSASLVGIVRLRGERFDAIFVFEPSPVTVGLPAIALRRLKGWPVAFWVLDQWPETLAAVGVVRRQAILDLVGYLVSFIYRRCDLILAQSRSLVGQIRKYSGDRPRVAYFPNWVEGSYVAPDTLAAPEVPPADGRFTVMFAGNIGESQDFPAILDAATRLAGHDDIRWVVVGDGRAAEWVRTEVARRGLDATFLLLGRFPQDRMTSFFLHADALLVSLKPDPVFAMTVPGKIQSYLAFGRPIIAMLGGEGARIIEEAGAGLTCPAGDSRRLAEIVRAMADLGVEERAQMGRNGAAYAHREFDRQELVRKLEMLLTEIGQASRQTAPT